mmetsp:Transcript_91686/g.280574  ORF Transcript_91686/g.280574 Transcript_91686/m.280574 type:complete len:231 (-) Transcript_91686:40-732(-)
MGIEEHQAVASGRDENSENPFLGDDADLEAELEAMAGPRGRRPLLDFKRALLAPAALLVAAFAALAVHSLFDGGIAALVGGLEQKSAECPKYIEMALDKGSTGDVESRVKTCFGQYANIGPVDDPAIEGPVYEKKSAGPKRYMFWQQKYRAWACSEKYPSDTADIKSEVVTPPGCPSTAKWMYDWTGSGKVFQERWQAKEEKLAAEAEEVITVEVTIIEEITEITETAAE